MSFEENIKQLNTIISKIENPEISIDEATKLFEKGIEVIKESYKNLESIKGKITILTKELESYEEKPFKNEGESNEG